MQSKLQACEIAFVYVIAALRTDDLIQFRRFSRLVPFEEPTTNGLCPSFITR